MQLCKFVEGGRIIRRNLVMLFFELLLIIAIPFGAKAAPVDAPAKDSVLTLTEAINPALTNNHATIQANLGVDLANARYQDRIQMLKHN